jgi:Ca-activated chloride channel family protein
MVAVYATVLDEKGRPVTGLGKNDFVVEENGRTQDVQTFAAGDVPLSLAVAVDHSFSLSRRQLRDVVYGTQRLIGALRPEDRVMLLGIGSQVEVLAPLSLDHRPAFDATARLEPWGTTPLFDAAREAIAAIDTASGRRALILISDGADRYSASTPADLVAFARRHDVLVYPVILGRRQTPTLADVAAVTGARVAAVEKPELLPDVLSGIASELRAQYLLGYVPSADVAAPAWRSIAVRVNRPGLRVRARDGYFASH